MVKSKFFILTIFLLFISNCATSYGPGRIDIKDTFSIDFENTWKSPHDPKSDYLLLTSADGKSEFKMEFFSGLEDGKPLYYWTKGNNFRKNMTNKQIALLYSDAMAITGFENEVSKIEPSKIGPFDGFMFEVKMNKKGKNVRSLVAGMVIDEKLFLIQFEVEEEKLFLKHIGFFKAMLASIKSIE
ncbi:MAG: hypothetical protein NPINA01_07460 [Nitrospinaceae bacterium]|nr:MAG: hypothetical protein NPINA01_07460 [Nitrospinaceae bacterium]